jgi:hypothetical protein
MNINRNNYEEFFLLYIDNELSVQDRNAVEQFVAQHTDLQQELQMLQETILPTPDFSYEDKDLLMKPDPVMQQQLLLLLDDELAGDAKSNIESLISSNKAVADEWQLLQQTKLLPPESIIFKDKASLYRRSSPAAIINMRWMRAAAAALLIGFGTWGALKYAGSQQSDVSTDNNLANKISVKKADTFNTNVKPVVAAETAAQTALVNNPAKATGEKVTVPVNQTTSNQQQANKTVPANNVIKNNLPDQQQGNTLVKTNANTQEEKPTNNLPTPLQNINRVESNKTLTATVTPLNRDTRITPPDNQVKLKGNDNDQTNNGAITAAYKPGDNTVTTTDDDDESTGKKSKLRGLLRKVKRVFDRNTNANSSTNAIKVAGFSFAIK